MLTVTDKAVTEFKELLADKDNPETLIRIFLQSIG